MLFKSLEMRRQWDTDVHPETRLALATADKQVIGWGWPQITITELERSPAENEEIYFKSFIADGNTPDIARVKAKARLTYHFKFPDGLVRAGDFRSSGKPYTPGQNDQLHEWMKEAFAPRFEVLFHDMGSGLHHHLGLKDEVALTDLRLERLKGMA